MRLLPSLACVVILLAASAESFAAKPKLLELKLDNETIQGKMVAHNQSLCWLMERDGNLRQIELRNVTEFRTLSNGFRRMKVAEFRKQLRREFKKPYEIKSTQHYVVCATTGKAKQYAQLFETIYRTFTRHISARGFRISKPDFPLVAIVFPDFKSFREYSRKVGVRAFPGLKGYYLPTTNRVALYDDGNEDVALDVNPLPQHALRRYARIRGNFKETLIHEATHQVAFNVGLHSRIGESPVWVVEGLATIFEAPGIRDRSHGEPKSRINPYRFLSFKEFVKKRRKQKSLADFIKSDTLFRRSILDAYAQAWALSFYLIETRPAKYMQYLKTIAKRDPLKPYTPEERLSDFTNTFGEDLNMFETALIRYIDRLQ
ncbi:MAG: DUF1570 domain-containing protein [Planctomycetes bacterium]|nr:DUF1570 domain-containing protein [Planctomycetota bacterium]